MQKFAHSDGTGGIQYALTPHTNGYQAPACTRPAGFTVPTTTGTLVCVADAQGRQLNFNVDSSGRLNQFADPLGQITGYTFDANGNLASVVYSDGKTKTYLYEHATHKNALTGILDENGTRTITYSYDASGKAVGEVLAGNVGTTTLAFGTNATTVTDARGTARTYNFQTILGVQKTTCSRPSRSRRSMNITPP